ncbi:MAG: phospho-sugar mutase [Bacteroidota bacterium]
MSQEIHDKANKWLASNIDDASKQEIQSMLDAEDSTELVEAFYKDLEFGTGGLRGIMGVGSNRMNRYTVGMATQGLANYLKQSFPGQEIKVVIAYDSRNNSRKFANDTASVFSANDIHVYFFDKLRPTPELSFAIRHFGAQSGVVLTASHNPKEYNGYKAYWDDGAQLTPPHDNNVIEEVKKIQSIDDINFTRKEDKIEVVDEQFDQIYLDAIKGLSLAPEAIAAQKDLKIVFSSIHGTGIELVPPVLKAFGFENVHVVEEQAEPNGNFPTVVYPNPEEAEAMSLALKKAADIDADLVMATDPDSDRVGIAVKNHKGEFQLLNGNQTGSLLIYYLLTKWKENGKLDGKQYVVNTVVTTDLIKRIAEGFDVNCYSTLTGFKYIATLIKDLEGKEVYIGGGEESYGYLIGDFVRDKDAISSCAMIAEMTAYAKNQGKSLFDMLIDMYEKFGFFKEKLMSLTKKGKSGAEEIQQMMIDLRNNPPAHFNGSKIIETIDYKTGIKKDLSTGNEEKIDFPTSNVLQFFTEDGCKISARPSGTEPKIKFYFSVNSTLQAPEQFDKVADELDKKIAGIADSLGIN